MALFMHHLHPPAPARKQEREETEQGRRGEEEEMGAGWLEDMEMMPTIAAKSHEAHTSCDVALVAREPGWRQG